MTNKQFMTFAAVITVAAQNVHGVNTMEQRGLALFGSLIIITFFYMWKQYHYTHGGL